ncbi:MAG: N-acetylneuraminate synthase family protein [Candidatus Omnitrophica bacterium]|nr:N-acetylneuraminate synthase family protein [Candidatus Omnitrophota bacterium]
MKVGQHTIGAGHPVFIIGEIGTNHNGRIDTAKELIDMAAAAGVNAVKFQTFKATDIINPTLPADYDPQEPVPSKYTYFHEYIAEYELPYEWHDELITYASAQRIEFISTPCSLEAVDFLADRIPAYKIASMDLNNVRLLNAVGRKQKPVIISSGIGSLGDIEKALDVLRGSGCPEICLLHCVSNYPAKPAELNLRNIKMLAAAFGVPVGFSDHSLGFVSSVVAVALGACVIEKHITLDRTMPGPDHSFALDKNGLTDLVTAVREAEASLGRSTRSISADERPKISTYRRSICSNKPLAKGHRVTAGDIDIIRPGNGIDPYDLEKVIGLSLQREIAAFTPLSWELFKDE